MEDTMDFKELIEHSWSNTLKYIGPVLLLTIVYWLVCIFSFGILAPVTTAGYIHSFIRAARENRTPEIKDLFSQMGLFIPLFIFFLIFVCVFFIGCLLLVLPGIAIACFTAFATLYMLPLMTDKGLGLIDALKESWNQAVKPPVTDHLVITVIYALIYSIGGALPLAMLIAQPVATFFLAGAYRKRVDNEEKESLQPPPVQPPPPPGPSETE